jgi:hypothetical protein
VGRRDLEDAGPEGGLNVVVGEDLYLALDERYEYPAADEVLVTFVFRVYDEGDIAEHGLGARGERLGKVIAVGAWPLVVHEGVAQSVEPAVDLLVVDL